MTRRKSPGGTMNADRCMVCSRYWAHNGGARRNFAVITRVCPDCIAASLPLMGKAAIKPLAVSA